MDNWRLDKLLTLLREDDKDSFVRYALAQEYLKLNQSEEAIVHFEALKTNDPAYVGLYYHLAAAYEQQKSINKALITYTEGISIAKQLGDQHALSELMNAKMNLEIEM